jgi:hypothetical protein
VDVRELQRGQPRGHRALSRLRQLALGQRPPHAERNTLRHRSRLGFALGFVLLPLLLSAPSTLGADPSPGPTPSPAIDPSRPPTCAERFPDEGPAGVDLRLGCIVGSVVGVYTTAQSAMATPLSSYAIMFGIVIGIGVVAVWFVGRLLARRAGERLAPVMPVEWWVCGTCKSVNGAQAARCYSCGSTRPVGPTMSTDEHPGISQSFGSKRKSG